MAAQNELPRMEMLLLWNIRAVIIEVQTSVLRRKIGISTWELILSEFGTVFQLQKSQIRELTVSGKTAAPTFLKGLGNATMRWKQSPNTLSH